MARLRSKLPLFVIGALAPLASTGLAQGQGPGTGGPGYVVPCLPYDPTNLIPWYAWTPGEASGFTKTIVAHGNHLAVWVNGYQVSDFTDRRKVGPNARENCKLDAGIISIQGHDPTTDLSFRNLKVAPLPKSKKK